MAKKLMPAEAVKLGLCCACALDGRRIPAPNGLCDPCREYVEAPFKAQGITFGGVEVIHQPPAE